MRNPSEVSVLPIHTCIHIHVHTQTHTHHTHICRHTPKKWLVFYSFTCFIFIFLKQDLTICPVWSQAERDPLASGSLVLAPQLCNTTLTFYTENKKPVVFGVNSKNEINYFV